jgi:hypothetical protein
MIERHMSKTGMEYPIASVSGSDLDKMYGVKGFPSAYLVDTNGYVIWTGHPGNINPSVIKDALEGASYVHPLDGSQFKSINKQLTKKNFGAALKVIEKELLKTPDDAELMLAKESLDSMIESANSKAAAYSEEGDFGLALDLYTELAKNFKGHDAEDGAKVAAKAISKNPEAKEELAAHKKALKGDQAQLAGDREKAKKAYQGVAKKYPDTKAGARASSYLSRH